MNITETVLRPALSTAAARPLITHYDEDAGTRIELSVLTVANWAAKTANWLTEEFDVEPGDPVCVRLPSHWQTAGVLLGAWWCGAHVVDEIEASRVAFVGPSSESTDSTTGAEGARAVVALDPLGGGLTEQPGDGAFDYLAEAKLAGDEFTPVPTVDGETLALGPLTVNEALGKAQDTAHTVAIGTGDRVLSTWEWSVPDGVLGGLLAPLVAGASLVQITAAKQDKLADRRAAERTTVDLLAE